MNIPNAASDGIPDHKPECSCSTSITNCDLNNECAIDNTVPDNNRNKSFNSNKHEIFNFHLGILIFAPFFKKLETQGLQFIRQWLVSVLLGCQNIEQSKILNYNSLKAILGRVHKTLRSQRLLLKEAATRTNTGSVLKFNAELLKLNQQTDFYYDPHTKHYSGHLKILATWCPSVRLADKGINMDYIHTKSGHPVYFDSNDNFYDLRERFYSNINKFRLLCGFKKDSVLTHVIDRGIYSLEVFQAIIKDPYNHIVTWEKGYEKNKWNEDSPYMKGFIEKKRNNKEDVKLIHYGYQEMLWDKDNSMRQVIVRIFDKNWDTLIEVAVLTDDIHRHAGEIIELMFTRWVQENDFKYTIKHFGLNQITSYAFIDYKSLKNKIEDKLYICNEHKTLTKEIHKVRAKLKTSLLQKHKFEKKHNDPLEELSVKEQERKIKIDKMTEQLNNTLIDLEQQRQNTTKYVSKIDELIKLNYNKLDTNAKDFMDAIKMLARNIFYLSFQPFKEKYNNYRDDHVLFRHLTRSPGNMEITTDGIKITLNPQMEYQQKVKKIISEVLDEINNTKPKLIDGTNKPIQLFIKN